MQIEVTNPVVMMAFVWCLVSVGVYYLMSIWYTVLEHRRRERDCDMRERDCNMRERHLEFDEMEAERRARRDKWGDTLPETPKRADSEKS